jgi:hypothetical protein
MIICDPTKYYEDSQLLEPSKRTPRPVEDIEVIGLIPIPEIISLSTERNSACKITEISSITMNFADPSMYLTIYDTQGSVLVTGGSLHIVNSRQPDPAALLSISGNNPLRFQHGWYTVNTGRSILNINTNSRLSINNVGLTNNNISCNGLLVENKSCYANGSISAPWFNLIDSFAYNINTNIDLCAIVNSSKADNMYIQGKSGFLHSSSIADSEMSYFQLDIRDANIIDSKLDYYYTYIDSSQIQSQLSETDGLLISGLFVPNNRTEIKTSTIRKNGILQSSVVSAEGVIVSGGTIKCNILRGLVDPNGDSEPTASQNTPVTVLREGKLICDVVDTHTVSGLSTISGSIEIGYVYNTIFGNEGQPLNISNNGGILDIGSLAGPYYLNRIILNSISGGKNTIHNNVLISNGTSLHNSIIEGDFLELKYFTNSGTIKTKTNKLIFSNNYGIINDAIFSSGSVNYQSGIISKATFERDSINRGLVTEGLFIHRAINYGDVSNATFSGSYEDGGPLINNGFVKNGIFFAPMSTPIIDVINNGSGNTIKIAGTAKNNGPVYELLTVSDSGQNLSADPFKMEFYNNSVNSARITGEAIFKNSAKNEGGGFKSTQNYYNFSKAYLLPEKDFQQSICNFYNYSSGAFITNTISGEMNFYDFSQLNNGVLDSGIFYDSSKIVSGPVAATLLYFKDNSSCRGNLNVISGLFLDESINHNTILADYIKFANNSKNLGNINGGMAEFVDNAINTGLIQVAHVYFQQSATNTGQIYESSWVYFLENSVNNGFIGSSTNVFFDQSSINRGSIMGFFQASFFNNAQSYVAEPVSVFIERAAYNSNSTNLDSLNAPALIVGDNILFSGSVNYAPLTVTNVVFNNAENNAYVIFTTRDSNGFLSGIPGIYAAIKGCENVSFVSGSTNSKPIKGCGSVTYNNSINNGRLSDINTISFNSSTNNSSIYADVTFTNYSTNNGFISGDVTFTNHSHNYGQISGSVCFDNTSFNYGEVLEINCA